MPKQKQQEILNIIKNLKDKPYLPPISSDTKVIKVFDGYVRYFNKRSATFDIDYLDSLTISEFSYFVYNYSEASGYKVIATLFYLDDMPIMSLLLGNESSYLNDIGQQYDLDKITALSLAGGVGYCVIHNDEIWVVNGKAQTDIETFLKGRYTLEEYRDLFLQSIY